MKNPLPATLWFLRHDAGAGLLQKNGFVFKSHPTNDEPTYVRDRFHLFRKGFWIEKDDHYLLYRNPSRGFYRLNKEKDPMGVPGRGEERVRLEDGFREIEKILQSHEDFVTQKMGPSYRPALISKMPRAEKRYAKNWKMYFCSEARSHSTSSL